MSYQQFTSLLVPAAPARRRASLPPQTPRASPSPWISPPSAGVGAGSLCQRLPGVLCPPFPDPPPCPARTWGEHRAVKPSPGARPSPGPAPGAAPRRHRPRRWAGLGAGAPGPPRPWASPAGQRRCCTAGPEQGRAGAGRATQPPTAPSRPPPTQALPSVLSLSRGNVVSRALPSSGVLWFVVEWRVFCCFFVVFFFPFSCVLRRALQPPPLRSVHTGAVAAQGRGERGRPRGAGREATACLASVASIGDPEFLSRNLLERKRLQQASFTKRKPIAPPSPPFFFVCNKSAVRLLASLEKEGIR